MNIMGMYDHVVISAITFKKVTNDFPVTIG